MPPPPPSRIGAFEIVSEIGRGAMAAVYLARWTEHDPPRTVALKVLGADVAQDRDLLDRLRRESRAASVLKHPNIVQAIDFGEADGFHYFAMEHVPGRSLQAILDAEGPLDERRALSIARQVAMALHHADRFGIVHRDIKPSNILVTHEGAAKLADFGIAKEVRRHAPRNAPAPGATAGGEEPSIPGTTFGTPFYMSPEQARGIALDTRSDIYSLGATVYRVLTGRFLHEGQDVREILRRCVEEPAPDPRAVRPELSEEAALLVLDMTAKDRRRRIPSPVALLQRLGWVLDGPPVAEVAEEDEGPRRPRPFARRPGPPGKGVPIFRPPPRRPGPRRP